MDEEPAPTEQSPLLSPEDTGARVNGENLSGKICKCLRFICSFWPKTLENKVKAWTVGVTLLMMGIQTFESLLVLCKRAHLAKHCIKEKDGNYTLSKQPLDIEYIFYYLGGYSFILLLRLLEFYQLAKGVWKLAKGLDDELARAFKAAFTKDCPSCTRSSRHVGRTTLLLLMFLSALTYGILGIFVEKEYAQNLRKCTHYSYVLYWLHLATCGFNLLTHTIYVLILIAMMGASRAMERMLFADGRNCQVTLEAQQTPQAHYNQHGRKIRLINKVFQGWFFLPLAILLLKIRMPAPRSRLRPWVMDDNASITAASYELVHLGFLVLFTIVQIDSAHRFVAVHKKYVRKLKQHGEVKEDERNNFTPKLGATAIPLNSVTTTFLTLIGVMLCLGDSFLSTV